MKDEPAPPLRVERIIAALEEQRVKYVLVGGIAGRYHGAQRATSDLDICPAWDRENLERLTAALKALGAHLKGFGHEPDAQGIRSMEITNWRTASGDVDVLLGIPDRSHHDRAQYRRLAEDALVVEVGEASILVASLQAIIRSKEITDREKDHEALSELRALADQSTLDNRQLWEPANGRSPQQDQVACCGTPDRMSITTWSGTPCANTTTARF